jgi:hypothetical protein
MDEVMGYSVCTDCGFVQENTMVWTIDRNHFVLCKKTTYSKVKNFKKKMMEVSGRLYVERKYLKHFKETKTYSIKKIRTISKAKRIPQRLAYSLYKLINGKYYLKLTLNEIDCIINSFQRILRKFKNKQSPNNRRKNIFYYKFIIAYLLDKHKINYPDEMFIQKTKKTRIKNQNLLKEIME